MSISVAHRAAAAAQLGDAAAQVEEKLRNLSFLPHWQATGAALRDELLITFSELILPRLSAATRPLLVVVAGSTGAGKSTLVNSILGAEYSKASVLRPTTRKPVLLHNPADEDPVGGELAPEVDAIATPDVPRGLALIDSPDIDSIQTENRERALKMLSGADLWLFVTTPTRYGDAVPWQVLAQAADRDVSIAVVLNRTAPEEKRVVRSDLARRLREAQLGTAPLFVIADAGAHHGLLSAEEVEPVSRWLRALAGSAHARVVAQRSLRGALDTAAKPLGRLEEILAKQDEALAAVAQECSEAEDLLRDRARRPLAEIAPASEEIGAVWRKYDEVWHLLNVPSGERLKIRRRDRAAITTALQSVYEAIHTHLEEFSIRQYEVLDEAVSQAVKAVELDSEWQSKSLTPEKRGSRFETWAARPGEIVGEWLADKSNKLRRSQARALGEAAAAQLVLAAAIGLRSACALLGTIFGEGAIDAAEGLTENLTEVQGEVTADVVIGVQNQLLALLPMRRSGEQLARARQNLQETQ